MFQKKLRKGTFHLGLFIILLSTISFVVTSHTVALNAAATGKKAQHHIEKIRKEQIFSKTYTVSSKTSGRITVRIRTSKIDKTLKVALCGSSMRYNHRSNVIPFKELKVDKKGKICGQIKTDHIVMADTYKVIIQSKGVINKSGTIKTDIIYEPAEIDEKTYQDLNNNDTPSEAKDYNITNHKEHKRILSGFDEQCDYADYDRLYIDKDTFLSLRIKTISNKKKEHYHVRLVRYWDNAVITEIDNPKYKLVTRMVHLMPGYYYLQISSSDGHLLKDNQIIYSIYMAKTINISSVSTNKQELTLYDLRRYNETTLSSRINGKKASRHDVIYKSSHPSVASVSSTGKVTAKTCGKTTITCYAIDKPSVKATCRVIVKKPRLKISIKRKKLYIGNRTPCSVQKLPKKLKVAWKSTNPSVASVSSKGIVTGRSVGKARIYAISREGILSNPCSITVKKKLQPKPDPKPTPEEEHDKIAPVLSISSAHLSPKGTITVTANVSGGTFRASGAIAIKNSYGKSCVIRATAARGSGTISYQLNGKSTSKNIVIY